MIGDWVTTTSGFSVGIAGVDVSDGSMALGSVIIPPVIWAPSFAKTFPLVFCASLLSLSLSPCRLNPST